jgi:hypothetical protein
MFSWPFGPSPLRGNKTSLRDALVNIFATGSNILFQTSMAEEESERGICSLVQDSGKSLQNDRLTNIIIHASR